MSLNDSQVLRFIDELNGIADADEAVREIKRKLRYEKRKPRSRSTKRAVAELYDQLYDLQFQKDYICIVIDRESDYDRANQGFSVNGVKYRRFLGTNGGIKHSTIVYVSERLYPELKKRLDNGRNKEMPIVPAKLEAYQALICSGSIPITEPKGIIVVNDCITKFKDNVIMINDDGDGEPNLKYVEDYEIEHNDSDGYGLMLPSYSTIVSKELENEEGKTVSGMNVRYAWTKGMVYTFDFVEFAEKIAGKYEIVDAWGDVRDVRNAEVILTTSMLKLWDSYSSWEDFYKNCKENHYQFSATKTTPHELESVRNMNYQFLQSYDFTDEELNELCKPTIDEIRDILGMDYRKVILYLSGFGLTDENAFRGDDYSYISKALMAMPEVINDPFIVSKVYDMAKTRITRAKTGCIQVHANFAMIGGDPYALCQSMFGMDVTGLLAKGEVYHKYWIDKGADEIVCFRAPMTCHNNIRKLKLKDVEETRHWYQYITTAIILNAFDTTCDAMNGADKDGDTFMCTDNKILLEKTKELPTIICMQHKAEKVIPSEEDIIRSNKLAFNDDIGVVTNHITSMFDVQAGFDENSEEYKALSYRIMCGQLYQQNTIDRAKGIIAKPMPKYWYDRRSNLTDASDGGDFKKEKDFRISIVADKKPYFMIYVYPDFRKEYNTFVKNANAKSIRLTKQTIDEIKEKQDRNEVEEELLFHFKRRLPANENRCVGNRVCWIFENEFDGYISKNVPKDRFDHSIFKSGKPYSREVYNNVLSIYKQYVALAKKFKVEATERRKDKYDIMLARQRLIDYFRMECEKACTNAKELCDIVLDICYHSKNSKQFAWDVCGETIIENLLEKSGGIIHYPQKTDEDGDFEYCGNHFSMKELLVEGFNDNTE